MVAYQTIHQFNSQRERISPSKKDEGEILKLLKVEEEILSH